MDMSSIMQQAQQMHQKMKKIQDDLAKKIITGSAGGGMVNVQVNGQGEILQITIDPAIVSRDDVGMLQDLITAAANDAMRKAKDLSKQELGALTGGLNLPGLGNFF